MDFIAVSESTPGPFAVNISTFVGMRTAGIPGALCATFGVVLPSFLIIILVAKFYEKFRKSSIVQGCMTGLKPAVVGLIAAALVTTGQAVFFPAGISAGVFTTPAFLCSAGIFAAMLALSLKNLHPIVVILISAAFSQNLIYPRRKFPTAVSVSFSKILSFTPGISAFVIS